MMQKKKKNLNKPRTLEGACLSGGTFRGSVQDPTSECLPKIKSFKQKLRAVKYIKNN